MFIFSNVLYDRAICYFLYYKNRWQPLFIQHIMWFGIYQSNFKNDIRLIILIFTYTNLFYIYIYIYTEIKSYSIGQIFLIPAKFSLYLSIMWINNITIVAFVWGRYVVYIDQQKYIDLWKMVSHEFSRWNIW
jgi:hypothetical protein